MAHVAAGVEMEERRLSGSGRERAQDDDAERDPPALRPFRIFGDGERAALRSLHLAL
jgi:hypothetical protein